MGESDLHVTLIKWTPNPEQLIVSAARLCYAANVDTIFDHDSSSASVLLKRLKKMGHLSPFEHASFSFYIQGVSRAMTHQLVRHRIASYSQRSQRYVSHKNFDYIVPSSLKGKTVLENGREIAADQYFHETMKDTADRYNKLIEALGGSKESSNQDARYILPNACESKIIVTMNARELIHFFEERLCERAQWEIRQTAEKMLELVKEKSPDIFSGTGPKCVRLNGCPEGKMSCGKFMEKKSH